MRFYYYSGSLRDECLNETKNILTGTPGSGKTSILHELKNQGFPVVEEAATDVIAREQRHGTLERHVRPDFIDPFYVCTYTGNLKQR